MLQQEGAFGLSRRSAHQISELRSVPHDQRDAASNASHSAADRLPDRSIGGDEDDERSLSVSSLDWSVASDADINGRISWAERVYKDDEDVPLQELQRFVNTDPDSAEEARADEVIKKRFACATFDAPPFHRFVGEKSPSSLALPRQNSRRLCGDDAPTEARRGRRESRGHAAAA